MAEAEHCFLRLILPNSCSEAITTIFWFDLKTTNFHTSFDSSAICIFRCKSFRRTSDTGAGRFHERLHWQNSRKAWGRALAACILYTSCNMDMREICQYIAMIFKWLIHCCTVVPILISLVQRLIGRGYHITYISVEYILSILSFMNRFAVEHPTRLPLSTLTSVDNNHGSSFRYLPHYVGVTTPRNVNRNGRGTIMYVIHDNRKLTQE